MRALNASDGQRKVEGASEAVEVIESDGGHDGSTRVRDDVQVQLVKNFG